MTESSKLKALVVTSDSKFLNNVYSYLSELSLELVHANSDWYLEPTSDRADVVVLVLASDWRSKESLEFLERFRSTWQGWYGLVYVIEPEISDEDRKLGLSLGVKDFLNERKLANERPRVVSEIKNRIKVKTSFENLLDSFSTALEVQDPIKIRHSIESLIFFDTQLLPLVSRILISQLRSNEDVVPLIKRLQTNLGRQIELDLCLLVRRMLSAEPVSGQLRKFIEKHGAGQLILRSLLGGFYFSQNQVKGQNYDFFDTAFRSCWGDAFTDFFFGLLYTRLASEGKLDRYEELLSALRENPIYESLVERVERIATLSTEDVGVGSAEQSEGEAISDIGRDVVGNLLESVVNLDLKAVIKSAEEAIESLSNLSNGLEEVPEGLRNTKWLFYHFNPAFIASFEKFLKELSWNQHVLTDDVAMAFASLKAERFDGLIVPFDKIDDTSFKLLESMFLDRNIRLPLVLMLAPSLDNLTEYNSSYSLLPISHFAELPQSRKALVKLMHTTYGKLEDSEFNFLNELRVRLNSLIYGRNESLKHRKDLIEDYMILRAKSPLSFWGGYDLLSLAETEDESLNKEEIYSEFDDFAPSLIISFMAKCTFLMGKGTDNNQLSHLEKEFWKLPGINANHATFFGELLLRNHFHSYLGRFLQNWMEDKDLKKSPGYYFLCYLYYDHFEIEELKMLGLYKAIKTIPRSWNYLQYLIKELVDSFSQTELQSVVGFTMKLSEADRDYCRTVLAESFYKTNNTNLGDRLLQELISENPMNPLVREMIVKYQRQGKIKAEI